MKNRDFQSDGYAIVGMSLRYPGFADPHSFATTCHMATSKLSRMNDAWARRFSGAGRVDGDKRFDFYRITNTLYGSISEHSWFDPKTFTFPPLDVEGDPSHFLCLQAAHESLLDYTRDREGTLIPKATTGVIVGRGDHPHRGLWSALQCGMGIEQLQDILEALPLDLSCAQLEQLVLHLGNNFQPKFSPSLGANLVSNVISGLISHKLDLHGPNFLVDAACASAPVALKQAMHCLECGDADLMVVGSVQGTMSVPIYQLFSCLGAIASTDIQPFNPSVSGTILAEGVGFIVIKRLADAVAGGDFIYSVIRAVGIASDGKSPGILTPSSTGQVIAMQRAYQHLNDITPDDVGYLEAHATGIELGDATELESIRAIFCGSQKSPPLAIGALKSIIGHSIPASGIAAIVRASFALMLKTIPPSRCEQVGPALCELNNRLYLSTSFSPWYAQPGRTRVAAVNCFGFGGINGHVVLQEFRRPVVPVLLAIAGLTKEEEDDATLHESLRQDEKENPKHTQLEYMTVSTQTPVLLIWLEFSTKSEREQVLRDAMEWLQRHQSRRPILRQFCQSSGESSTRISLQSDNTEMLLNQLESLFLTPNAVLESGGPLAWLKGIGGKISTLKRLAPPPKTVFMLPGESANRLGVLQELAGAIPAVKELLEFMDSASIRETPLGELLHPSWQQYLAANERDQLTALINSHDVATELLFVTSMAYGAILSVVGLRGDAYMGHSTGEINALALAGAVNYSSTDDVRRMLADFHRLYESEDYASSIPEGRVFVVSGLNKNSLHKLIRKNPSCHLVSDNSPSHRLLFSSEHDLEAMNRLVAGEGGFCLPTTLNRPYHTPLFGEGAALMRRHYDELDCRTPRVPVYSCSSAEPYPEDPNGIRDQLAEQWRSPVMFARTLRHLYRDGYRCLVELNSCTTLASFAEAALRAEKNHEMMIISTGAVGAHSSVGALVRALSELWHVGHPIIIGRLESLFSHRSTLKLPISPRPQSAVTLQHALHHFPTEEIRNLFATPPASSVASPQPMVSSQSCDEAVIVASNSFKNQETSTTTAMISKRQELMNRFLTSMSSNTLNVVDRLQRPRRYQLDPPVKG